jgi:hypothetical protein
MKKFKNKKTGEIVEAIQFSDSNLHRMDNYVRAIQGSGLINNIPTYTIRINDDETSLFKKDEWCVNRDKSFNVYSEIFSEKEFENLFESAD